MNKYLGIDTSNYTTSVSLYSAKEMIMRKKPLPVKPGELGLRQSDAVFHHVNNLAPLIKEVLPDKNITAIGVSKRPRNIETSYMPCFNSGVMAADVISAALDVPVYYFSHQEGHIASALYSADRLDLIGKKFIAFHMSGGTTEAVLVEGDAKNPLKCRIIAKTLDINAGQVIDRVGVMMGLEFPCGAELESYALLYDGSIKTKPCLKEENMCLSGLENQCIKLYKEFGSKEKTAAYCIEYIKNSLYIMTMKLLDKYGDLPLVYSGGVMSNSIIREYIKKQCNGIFAQPCYSSDNASGIAVLTCLKSEGRFVQI